jgi:predicted CXXCH cytochrome family protein
MFLGRGPSRGWLGAVALAAVLLVPAGWMLSDRLEQDNDFCNACHWTPERRFHARIRDVFDARPGSNLASAHAVAGNEERADKAFRCIDCHGGAGLLGRARVKVLAARDAFWYLVGDFEEPESMRWPLWDEDCTKCHPTFGLKAAASGGAKPFHAVPLHNTGFEVRCVSCHTSHEAGGNPQAYFLDASRLRPLCARCHPEFLEEGS